MVDTDYLDARTEGFDRVKSEVATYWPERVERITGVAEAELTRAAHLLGNAESAMILTGRGTEQQAQGVNNVSSCINLALALGLVGQGPTAATAASPGRATGQGGREHGQEGRPTAGLPPHRRPCGAPARGRGLGVWTRPRCPARANRPTNCWTRWAARME